MDLQNAVLGEDRIAVFNVTSVSTQVDFHNKNSLQASNMKTS